MSLSKKLANYFSASTILAGTILGAGVFSLPFVFTNAGSFLFVIFLILLMVNPSSALKANIVLLVWLKYI